MGGVGGVEDGVLSRGVSGGRGLNHSSAGELSWMLRPLGALRDEWVEPSSESAASSRESSSGTWESSSRSWESSRVLRVPPLPGLLPGHPAADAVDGLAAGGVGGGAGVLVAVQGGGGVVPQLVERVALLKGHASAGPKKEKNNYRCKDNFAYNFPHSPSVSLVA